MPRSPLPLFVVFLIGLLLITIPTAARGNPPLAPLDPLLPSSVVVSQFTAQGQTTQIVLMWTTASEDNNRGFNILRSTSRDGTYTRINEVLIPSKCPTGGTCSPGADYSFNDVQVNPGQTYFYLLQSVDNNGQTQTFGPVSASTTTGSITPSPSATGTGTPTGTPSTTPSATATATGTGTSTGTPSTTPSATPTATNTPTATPTSTSTPTPTNTPTNTNTPTRTPTNTPTNTPTRTPTPTPVVDLIADKIEVTQSVQDLNNSVRLVKDKRTFVRFHVHSNGGTYLTFAQLKVQRGANVVWLYPINFFFGYIWVRPAPDRGILNHAFLFELPNGFKEGTVTITAYLNPVTGWRGRNPIESTYANNDIATNVTFEAVPAVNVVHYSVGYGFFIFPRAGDPPQMADWIRRAYPLSRLNVWYRAYYHGFFLPSCNQVNAVLWSKKVWDLIFFWTNNIPLGARYYGMVDDRGGFMRGCAPALPAWVASGPTGSNTWGWDTDGSYGDWYGAHELGHDWSRGHANFCGAVGGPAYPYPNGEISPVRMGNTAQYGFDIRTYAIYRPWWHDVMSYCQNQWIGRFTSHGLMSFYQSTPVIEASGEELREVDQTNRLLVAGSIDPATNAVELQPLYVIPNAGDVEPRVPGDYTIVLRNAAGEQLQRYPFTPEETEGGPLAQAIEQRPVALLFISELVPYVDGTSMVDIEGPRGLLRRVSAGPNPPTVTVTSPNGGEILSGNTITVTWTARDPDGDPLSFDVQYSPDNGATWEMVAQNITGTSIVLDSLNVVSGSQGLFRVWASDGIHTASDQSDAPFIVPNHAPTVRITNPITNTTIVLSQTLTLEAFAYDIDMGTVPDNQLQWISNIDGVLGNGATLSVATLRVGTHIITVRADDGVGGVTSASIQVTVVGDPTQAPPVPNALSVGPSPVVLNAANGLPDATLSIENQNAGNVISWNAVASAPWVQLSASSGTTPDSITISANGKGLTAGTYLATITFTSPDVPDQAQIVQVQLTISAVYLPVVMR